VDQLSPHSILDLPHVDSTMARMTESRTMKAVTRYFEQELGMIGSRCPGVMRWQTCELKTCRKASINGQVVKEVGDDLTASLQL